LDVKRSQLIDALAARFEGNKKTAADALDAVIDTITREVVRGEKVVIKGFGTFEKVLPKKSAVKKGTEDAKKSRRFVPRFSAAKELSGVVSGAIKLPKLPQGRAASLESVKDLAGKVGEAVGARASEAAAAVKKAPATSAPAGGAENAAPAASGSPAKKATSATSGSGGEKAAPAASGSPAKKATPATSASPAKKTAAKKAPAKKTAAQKAPAKKITAQKAPAKKTASKTAASKKTPAKKATATRSTAPAKATTPPPPAPGSASPATPPTPES
jgi:DNA-binding protein HU-beta